MQGGRGEGGVEGVEGGAGGGAGGGGGLGWVGGMVSGMVQGFLPEWVVSAMNSTAVQWMRAFLLPAMTVDLIAGAAVMTLAATVSAGAARSATSSDLLGLCQAWA